MYIKPTTYTEEQTQPDLDLMCNVQLQELGHFIFLVNCTLVIPFRNLTSDYPIVIVELLKGHVRPEPNVVELLRLKRSRQTC